MAPWIMDHGSPAWMPVGSGIRDSRDLGIRDSWDSGIPAGIRDYARNFVITYYARNMEAAEQAAVRCGGQIDCTIHNNKQ